MTQSKDKYRIRNWKQYNQSLINRGSITFWLDEKAVTSWNAVLPSRKPGRPNVYSDAAIRCGLAVRTVFRLTLRALQGFLQSMFNVLKLDLKSPHYSTFCDRAKGLQIPMSKWLKPGEKLHVIFDSTGLKIFGEGEWKVRKHGYSKRRTWRKLHVGMCAESGQVVVSAITSNDVSDDCAMLHMMDALDGTAFGDILGDGAYDTTECHEAIHDHGGKAIIPPDKTAVVQKKDKIPALESRDQAIQRIAELGTEGRSLWKREINYHRRSRIETFMFRLKTILGDRLVSRRMAMQATEATMKLHVLNRMLELGRPNSYKVAV